MGNDNISGIAAYLIDDNLVREMTYSYYFQNFHQPFLLAILAGGGDFFPDNIMFSLLSKKSRSNGSKFPEPPI
jgi:hypothetical protein